MENLYKKFGAFVRRVPIFLKSGPKPPDYIPSHFLSLIALADMGYRFLVQPSDLEQNKICLF